MTKTKYGTRRLRVESSTKQVFQDPVAPLGHYVGPGCGVRARPSGGVISGFGLDSGYGHDQWRDTQHRGSRNHRVLRHFERAEPNHDRRVGHGCTGCHRHRSWLERHSHVDAVHLGQQHAGDELCHRSERAYRYLRQWCDLYPGHEQRGISICLASRCRPTNSNQALQCGGLDRTGRPDGHSDVQPCCASRHSSGGIHIDVDDKRCKRPLKSRS